MDTYTGIPPVIETREPVVNYVHTTNIPSLFRTLGISILVSTYQAQRIMALSASGEKLSMLMRNIPRPTGLALHGTKMAVCSKNQIWFFDSSREIRKGDGTKEPHDIWITPRRSHVTGDILGHEIGWAKEDFFVVNTRFSCICTLSNEWSFTPVWKPKFVSAYTPEDRCHLNGFALSENGIAYVTALGETDTPGGWREGKSTGGCVIDYDSGEVVARGLCMPHSPRLYKDKLWVLESGKGMLHSIDTKSGQYTTVAQLPGYLRGLAFYDRFAFVGLCKVRENKIFGELPIVETRAELPCAIHIVDLTTGKSEGFIEFTKGIEELFDIQVLQGARNPQIVGFEEDTIDGLFMLP